MRLKGFLFTIDAMLAIAIISIAAYAIIALSVQQPNLDKSYGLEKVGRDALNLTADGVDITLVKFKQLTGKTMYLNSDNIPADAPLATRAVLYKYPKLCGCDDSVIGCRLDPDDECWDSQDITLTQPLECTDAAAKPTYKCKQEAWITP